MTQAQRQTAAGLMLWVKDYAPVIASILMIATIVGGGVVALAGGVTLQTQVTSAALGKQVTDIQGDISAIKRRLEDLPNAYEVGAQRTHFDRLDERISAIEKLGSNLDGRLSALEHPQYRNTPR